MQSKTTTTTTVLPTSLSTYAELRAELRAAIGQLKTPDPELVQNWLHQGLQSMATLGSTKEELLPVFRGLQVFALRESPSSGYQELHRTLALLDAELGPNKGGFSRLLDNALEAGSIEMPEQFNLEDFPNQIQEQYRGIRDAILQLQALDHLSHAFSLPVDLPACALILHSFISDLGDLEAQQSAMANTALFDLISLRQLPASITQLLQQQEQLLDLSQIDVKNIADETLIQPFLLWLLARYHQRLPTDESTVKALNEALDLGQLPPLEVLQRAQW